MNKLVKSFLLVLAAVAASVFLWYFVKLLMAGFSVVEAATNAVKKFLDDLGDLLHLLFNPFLLLSLIAMKLYDITGLEFFASLSSSLSGGRTVPPSSANASDSQSTFAYPLGGSSWLSY